MAPPSTSAPSRRFLLSADLVELLLPLHVLGELHELFGLHEDSLLRAGIVAAADVGHVTADDVLHDRDEIGVDARMARHVLFPKMKQVRRNKVHAVPAIAGAETDHRYRTDLLQVLVNFRGRVLSVN